MLDGKTILVTGGTGSFGNRFIETVLRLYKPHKVIVYSRDEFKQHQMQKKFGDNEALRFFLGDIRDKERMYRAFEGVDYIVHAAALKQVPALEYNPTEAVKTNVIGASNIIDVATDAGVEKVVSISTDKAVSPINLYGATKLVAEKLFVAANDYVGKKTKFSSVRYGNVLGSRGSVLPIFMDLKNRGIKEFPITDPDMTRFWITLHQGINLVLLALKESDGGEIFIPRIPSMTISALARAIDPDCTFKILGIRPGEKIHETLISKEEARATKVFLPDVYVILPQFFQSELTSKKYDNYPSVPCGFEYSSDNNDLWLSDSKLRELINNEK